MESAYPGPLWAELTPVRFIHRGAWSDAVEAHATGGALRVVKVAEAGGELAEHVEQFCTAALSLAEAVRHPNVITYRAVHVVEGWLSAERPYVEGVDVGIAVASTGRAPVEVAAAIAHAVAEGTLGVHAAGVVAGRIRPSHVLVARDGGVHLLGAGEPELTVRAVRDRAEHVDREVAFAPPERFAGASGDTSADVFGIAALLSLLVTGQPVIPKEHRLARVLVRRGAITVSDREAPPGLEGDLAAVVGASLRADPTRRPTLTQLSVALEGIKAPASELAGYTREVVGQASLGGSGGE